MPDYMLIGPNGEGLLAYKFDGQFVWRPGFADRRTHIELQAGEGPLDAIRRATQHYGDTPTADCTLEPTELPQGHLYPRMARPSHHHPNDIAVYPGPRMDNELASLRGQLVTLIRQLERVCQTVHPCNETFDAFGHDIRNLLILACTEAETHWRSVLIANRVRQTRYTTNDYVKLVKPMRLDEYAIALSYYPWLDPLKPFEGWAVGGRPTQDLPWYDAYNAVKHDREQNFPRSKLIHALHAVSACAVMLCAQFGAPDALRRRVEIGQFFYLAAQPKWRPTQVYFHPDHASKACWSEVPYPFP